MTLLPRPALDRRIMTSPYWPRIVPEEEAFCEDCGASITFCECGVPLDFITEEEREEVDAVD